MTSPQQIAHFILIVLLLVSCGCSDDGPAPEVDASASQSQANPAAEPDSVTHPLNLTDMTPIEYLNHLKSYHEGDCYYTHSVPAGWVKQQHLSDLFDLLDSDDKCALPVFAASSPHVDMGKGSTVGREAAFLIGNYMGQTYPATLGSRVSDQDKEELRNWWKEHRSSP